MTFKQQSKHEKLIGFDVVLCERCERHLTPQSRYRSNATCDVAAGGESVPTNIIDLMPLVM